ncbi:MAG: hypothetical protein ACTH5L_05905 [Halomonas sp.]|uniref:hypothetical protein n=1 Tax=Halomonas TaxID=2745 RepID=UPI000EBA90EB|nr:MULTISPECIES: hypothetical protein [Halomonas]HCR96869.1 hypothetical protein [Halomonas sp.]
MSEVTIEQLQANNENLTAELEKVKAKNAELLGKVKKAQQGSGENSERLEALEAENANLKGELRTYTYDAPVNAVFKEISGAGSIFRESFEKHFSIIQDECEGRFWIHDKDGNPVYKTVKQGKYGNKEEPRELTFNDIRDVIDEHGLEELDFFLPKPKGGGALGSNGRHYSRPAPTDEKPKEASDNVPTFGMR